MISPRLHHDIQWRVRAAALDLDRGLSFPHRPSSVPASLRLHRSEVPDRAGTAPAENRGSRRSASRTRLMSPTKHVRVARSTSPSVDIDQGGNRERAYNEEGRSPHLMFEPRAPDAETAVDVEKRPSSDDCIGGAGAENSPAGCSPLGDVGQAGLREHKGTPAGSSFGAPKKLIELMEERDRAVHLCLQYRCKLKNMEVSLRAEEQLASDLKAQLRDANAAREATRKLFDQVMDKVRADEGRKLRQKTSGLQDDKKIARFAEEARKARLQLARARKDLRELWLERDEIALLAGQAMKGEQASSKRVKRLELVVEGLRQQVAALALSERKAAGETEQAEARAAAAEAAERELRKAVEGIKVDFEALVCDLRLREKTIHQLEAKNATLVPIRARAPAAAAPSPPSPPGPPPRERVRPRQSSCLGPERAIRAADGYSRPVFLPVRRICSEAKVEIGAGAAKKVIRREGSRGSSAERRRGGEAATVAAAAAAAAQPATSRADGNAGQAIQTAAAAAAAAKAPVARLVARRQLTPHASVAPGRVMTMSYPRRGSRATFTPVRAAPPATRIAPTPVIGRGAADCRGSAWCPPPNGASNAGPGGRPPAEGEEAKKSAVPTDADGVGPSRQAQDQTKERPSQDASAGQSGAAGQGRTVEEGGAVEQGGTLEQGSACPLYSRPPACMFLEEGQSSSSDDPTCTTVKMSDLNAGGSEGAGKVTAAAAVAAAAAAKATAAAGGTQETEREPMGESGNSGGTMLAIRRDSARYRDQRENGFKGAAGGAAGTMASRSMVAAAAAAAVATDEPKDLRTCACPGAGEVEEDGRGAVRGEKDGAQSPVPPSLGGVGVESEKAAGFRSRLVEEGVPVTKYGGRGKPKAKVLWVSPDLFEIFYAHEGRTKNSKKSSHMPLAGLRASQGPGDCADLLRRAPAADRCFTLVQQAGCHDHDNNDGIEEGGGEGHRGEGEGHRRGGEGHKGGPSDGTDGIDRGVRDSPSTPGRRKWGIGGTLSANLANGRQWRSGEESAAAVGAAMISPGSAARSTSWRVSAVLGGTANHHPAGARERMGLEVASEEECAALVDAINGLAREAWLKKHRGRGGGGGGGGGGGIWGPSPSRPRESGLFDGWLRSAEPSITGGTGTTCGDAKGDTKAQEAAAEGASETTGTPTGGRDDRLPNPDGGQAQDNK